MEGHLIIVYIVKCLLYRYFSEYEIRKEIVIYICLVLLYMVNAVILWTSNDSRS